MDENGVTRIAKGERKENYKRENQKSWRMTMSKLLKSKVLVIIMTMLIVLVGGSSKVSAAAWEAALMPRNYTNYMYGAYESGKTYTPDQVKRVIFQKTEPSGHTDSWAVDDPDSPTGYPITSYIVPTGNTTSDGKTLYDQYIVCDASMIMNYPKQFFAKYQNMTEIIGLEIIELYGAPSFYQMFYNCKSLTSIDLSNFYTDYATNMSQMFSGCSSLTNLDLSSFDTSSVTDMSHMFENCSSLEKLDLSNFDTSKVKYMGSMFDCCSGLTELDVSSFDTSLNTSMHSMFYKCENLSYIDVSGFNTSNVTKMVSTFHGCKKLTSLDVSGFDTRKVTSTYLMFASCESLTTIDVSGFITTSLTEINYMFNDCTSVTSLDLRGFNTSNITEMRYLFGDCASLTSLDVSSFDTSNVTIFRGIFAGCESLTTINWGTNFDTSKATDMGSFFWNCGSFTSINFPSSFNTSLVTDMSGMFWKCKELISLDLSSFDFTNLTTMETMFNRCEKLTSITFPTTKTSKVTNFEATFAKCPSLTSIDLTYFDTSSATNMERMFQECSSLTSLDVSKFDTDSVTIMFSMFDECSSLKFLDLSSFNTKVINGTASYTWTDTGETCKDVDAFLRNCEELETLILGPNFTRLDGKNMFASCSSLKSIHIQKAANVTSEVISTADDTKLSRCSNATLYVPTKVAEGLYEANEIYLSALTADRIKPMIDLLGDNPMEVIIGSTFTDPSAKVIGQDTSDLTEIEAYGYSYAVATPSINTTAQNTYTIAYTLSFDYGMGPVAVATETRTVNVIDAPKLMERDEKSVSTITMLGAQRANKTTYTADLVDRIIFSTTIPDGYIVDAVWDVSKNNGDYTVVSYLKNSTTRTGYYDQYIVATGEILLSKDCSYLFCNYTNMRSVVNIQQINTSNVNSMTQMFSMCSALESVDLSGFDTGFRGGKGN